MHRYRGCVISDFICSKCGTIIPLPRNHGRLREKGHVKDLYCPTCLKVEKFREITYRDFYRNMDGEVVV